MAPQDGNPATASRHMEQLTSKRCQVAQGAEKDLQLGFGAESEGLPSGPGESECPWYSTLKMTLTRPHARRFAFSRHRTDGAGGFLGIERMSNQTIGEGPSVGVLVVGRFEFQSGIECLPTTADDYFICLWIFPFMREVGKCRNPNRS
jgi:hypothetical protein